jgi:ribonucleotide reductase alpha subunit
LAGEFVCVNKFLVKELLRLGLWSEKMKDRIILAQGSIQGLTDIPTETRNIFKTVWEITAKNVIDMAVDRGQYIDQSQSLNVHLENVTSMQLTSLHFYSWKKGLKTGMYYMRTQAASEAIQVTCSREDKSCTSCSG